VESSREVKMCWNIRNFWKYFLFEGQVMSSKRMEEKNISPEVAGVENRML
jgi:hypothetical protein